MDKLSAKFKQKKRKTRKCLNEIRRRSLHTMNNHAFSRSLENSKICITEDRLTLTMFPKVVRSETVTRPLKTDYPAQSRSEGLDEKSERAELSIIQLNVSESSDSNKHSEEKADNISTDNEMFRSRNGSPASLILFSSCDELNNPDAYDVPLDATFMTSSESSQNSEEVRLNFYEEFIKEIPVCLKQHTPALIKADVMKKTRKALQDIRLSVEGSQRDCDPINSQKRKNKIGKVPTVYPEEYVHLDSFAQLKYRPVSRHHLSVQHTPEYSYYPHKLNQ